jgi:hypothetical protein
MIQTKLCNSCDPPTEWPLNEKYFYKNKLSPDGLADKCRKCQKKNNLQRYYNKNKNLNKIYDVNGKSKVPIMPETKIKQRQLKQWVNNISIIVLQCRYCGKLHEINQKFKNKNCTCGRSIIFCGTVNHLWGKVLWKNKLLENYDISKFDPWK